ncbi:AAA family ATPase [Candidatus Poribacteria bacterium]|nr:AAA family ATPase [Candidatus Poribacteria bacterium]MYK24975.1 AAA family ATPase [Candidatus Poribacteria bacterium]
MSEQKAFLKKVHIKNFLSLRNVTLPLKPLTVLVGPNASGKSNILSALRLLKQTIIVEEPPTVKVIQNCLWAGQPNPVTFQLHSEIENNPVLYDLKLRSETERRFFSEKLFVKNVKIISLQEGHGEINDESGKNQTMYTCRPDKITLGYAIKYGNNSATSAFTEYIKEWNFYDFQPEVMGEYFQSLPFGADPDFAGRQWFHGSPSLSEDGLTYSKLLSFWHKSAPELFDNVSNSLAASTNINIGYRTINGVNRLCLLERYKNPIPVERASDGTLRLIAYYILLNQYELPPLIAIEEPERNLHPGVLKEIAYVLERIAERTQVIITTHSSQLLDTFSSESLSDWLGVLLLHNPTGLGTEVINIEEIRHERKALDSWIIDFGVGSAIFYSELLQDLMEKSEWQA